jgi:hypothetical protein
VQVAAAAAVARERRQSSCAVGNRQWANGQSEKNKKLKAPEERNIGRKNSKNNFNSAVGIEYIG